METILNTKVVMNPKDTDLAEAAQIIHNGGLVALPTETVYGLGVNALLAEAAPKVYAAKGRPSDNPLIIHLASARDAQHYAVTSPTFDRLAQAFMPGPLTVILPKRACIPDSVTGGLPTVAVRVPSHPIAHKLIELSGVPIAAPSANLSGRPSTTTVDHVIEDLFGRVDLILNGGPSDIGLESTIVFPKSDGTLILLRPGAITVEMLEEEGFAVTIDGAVTQRLQDGEVALAPGMKYRHYAPNARVILLNGEPVAVHNRMEEYRDQDSVALICYADDPISSAGNAYVLGAYNREDEQAHNLFDLLRTFDSMPQIETVYASLPDRKGIGLALFNRMLKAAGYEIQSV